MSYYRDIVRIIDEYRDKCKNMVTTQVSYRLAKGEEID